MTSFLQEQNISAAEIERRYARRQEQLLRGEREENSDENEEDIELADIEEGQAEEGEGSSIQENASTLLAQAQAVVAAGALASTDSSQRNGGVDEEDDSLIAEAQAAISGDEKVKNTKENQKATKKRKKGKGKAKYDSDDDADAAKSPKEPSRKVRIKRRNFDGDDSSDSDEDSARANFLGDAARFHDEENNEELFRLTYEGQGRIPGQTDFCASCHCKFTVSMTSEPAPPELQTDVSQHLLLCPSCSKDAHDKGKAKKFGNLSIDAIAASRIQRKRVAAALLDRKEFSVPSLLESCISLVSTHIDDVEALGDIGSANKDRLARILSRNRSLNTKTLKLFLDPSARNLEFWDCSEVSKDSLMLIPAYCPHLESLTLNMCGQLTSDILGYMATNLPNLKSISLDGAFLVTTQAWADFFLSMGERLKRLDIRNTHRLDSESLAVMIEACPQLTHLTLHRLSGLIDPAAFLMLPMLSNLVHLDLSHPPQDVVMGGEIDLITDETLTVILNSLGAQLELLVLDGCSELSDAFITNALRPCCCGSRLSRLSLASLDKITDSAVADLFTTWSQRHDPSRTVLSTVSFDRCYSLGDKAIAALLSYTRPSLVQLSISSLPDVSPEPFKTAFVDQPAKFQFPNLAVATFSFVRAFSNPIIEGLVDRAPNLEYIEVFGVPKVNRACKIRPGLKIIGRQDEM